MKITRATMARMMRIVHNMVRLRPLVDAWCCSVGTAPGSFPSWCVTNPVRAGFPQAQPPWTGSTTLDAREGTRFFKLVGELEQRALVAEVSGEVDAER